MNILVSFSKKHASFPFQFLASAGLYESQEEAVLREEVLGRLDQVESSLMHCSHLSAILR